MKNIKTKPIKHQIESMMNRLSRVNIETLSPEDLTRYENILADLEIKLQDVNITDSVESEIRKNTIANKKIETANVIAEEIVQLISSGDLNTNQKISKGIRYIEHVLVDNVVLELNQDLSNLEQVVLDAKEYLSTL
jgi:uncharacterized protein YbcI